MTIKYDPVWKAVQEYVGADVDGLPGGQTLYRVAFALGVEELWKAVQCKVGVAQDGVPGALTARAVADWLGVDVPRVWPTQAEVRSGRSIFGKAGDEKQMVTVELPFPMRLSWDTGKVVTRISCHRLVADSLVRIFERTLKHYGMERVQALGLDLYGGCFNDRTVVGGQSKSMHAWGIAVDVDPDRNSYSCHAPHAGLNRVECEAFWGFVEDEGAVSLGRERDYDWMHFQFARL